MRLDKDMKLFQSLHLLELKGRIKNISNHFLIQWKKRVKARLFFNKFLISNNNRMNVTELWNRNFAKTCLKIANLSESKKIIENETF